MPKGKSNKKKGNNNSTPTKRQKNNKKSPNKSHSQPKQQQQQQQRRNQHSNKNHSKNKRNNTNTFSTLYIIVAFSFAIIAFILGRAPLTLNFPILEQFYVYLPSFVTDLSNNLLYLFNLHEIDTTTTTTTHTNNNNNNTDQNDHTYNTNNNETGLNAQYDTDNINKLQPLTKSKIKITSQLMATAYKNNDVVPNLECDIDNWLMRNNVTLPGYHLLCVSSSSEEEEDSGSRSIQSHRYGVYNEKTSKEYTSDMKTYAHLRFELEKVLKIQRTDKKRLEIVELKDRWLNWALYDQYGRPITQDNYESLFFGIVLVFEVGLFQYPGIEIGFERNVLVRNMNPDSVSRQPYLHMALTTLSLHPVVLQVSGFIAPEYCDYIVTDSDKYMRRSTVSHMHNTKGDPNQWRTSSTHWLKNDDTIVHVIDCQTSSLTHLPLSHQENVQVLRYFEGEQYDSHWDYFDPSLYKGTEMEQKIRGGRNRFLTLFWYMSNVTDGGWTYFPMSGNLPRPKSFKLKKQDDCNVGLKVTPMKGNAIIFYSMKPDGEMDPLSLHGACPVGPEQIKWGANKWIWTRPVNSALK